MVVLGACADSGDRTADDVRYDLTVQGELVPRWDVQLALTPSAPDANADIVVKVRDRTVEQRWAAEPVRSAEASSESLSVTGPTAPAARYADLAGPVS